MISTRKLWRLEWKLGAAPWTLVAEADEHTIRTRLIHAAAWFAKTPLRMISPTGHVLALTSRGTAPASPFATFNSNPTQRSL